MWLKRKSPADVQQIQARAVTLQNGALALGDVALNAPGANEILIKVAYAGVNRADLLQRQGLYAPPEDASPILGLEVSGTIAAFGSNVIGWSEGENVCALVNGGGYSDYVVVPASQVLSVPPRLSMQEAACIPEACVTAWMALVQEGRLRDGETVLVHGGASGVGIMMVQLAQLLGAHVIATAGSAEKCAFIGGFGAKAIAYRDVDFVQEVLTLTEQRGVDVIIDILGGPKAATHLNLLRKGGRLVTIAFLEGNEAEHLPLSRLLTRHLHWSGVTLRGQSPQNKAELMEAVRKRVLPYLATGAVRPVIDSVFPLAQAEEAHTRMQERLHCGKILLEVAAHPE